MLTKEEIDKLKTEAFTPSLECQGPPFQPGVVGREQWPRASSHQPESESESERKRERERLWQRPRPSAITFK